MMSFLAKIFGTKHERDVKKILPFVEEINSIYEGLASLSDDALRAKTDEFRKRLADGETVDDLMTEAFAVVKEACRRNVGTAWEVVGIPTTWDMVHFDV